MKLAIHKSGWGFSKEWIKYCEENSIPHKIVDCYASDIVEQVKDCDLIMWHHHHTLAKDKVFAKELLYALEQSGKKVFPDFNTGWHFDDKLGQKYLLEAINSPLVPTEVFYSKKDALNWAGKTHYPKVFKLRGGAGATNVKLVKSRSEAVALIERAFGKGFQSYDKWGNLKEVFRKYRLKKNSAKDLYKSMGRLFISTEFARIHGKEKGYVLFQKFIENNDFDIRIIVIGNKAIGIKRLVRENDFRASGSGFIKYDKDEINIEAVKLAFEVTIKLKAQCVAYDFVFENNKPLIVEINYGFAHEAYFKCPGYWDNNLNWHEANINPAYMIIENLIKE